MGNQKTQLQKKENAEPLKLVNESADHTKPGKQASEKLMNSSGRRTSSVSDVPLTPESIPFLQRTIGNRAVNRLIQAKLNVGQPGDAYEREADRVAEQVTSMPEQKPADTAQTVGDQVQRLTPKRGEELQRQAMTEEEKRKRPEEGMVQMKSAGTVNSIQRQAMTEEERKKKPEENMMQTKEEAGETPSVSDDVESQIENMQGKGEQLPDDVRTYFESRFEHDFSGVRAHKGAQAEQTAQALNARAYTTGKDIVFGAGEYAPESTEGKKILAHELTHVVQQGSASKRVQRYEAGEHAQFGETQGELQKTFAPASYVVKKSEKLNTIAGMFGITVDELKEANKGKLKKWPASDGSGRMIEGFDEGETVAIPQQLNDMAKTAIKDKSAKFKVNGVELEYGVVIAMGDLFESPEQLAKASPDEIKELARLIKRERDTGKLVTTQQWEVATHGRYLKLASENVPHFAPQAAGRVKLSAAGAAASNHQAEWQKHHLAAINASIEGNKDKALMLNAFGDHFLTDAFAAGHLINKPDVMELFKEQLKLDSKGKEFTTESKKFFDDVANDAFTGGVASEFSQYEAAESYAAGWHPNINSASRFSALLQEIHKVKPDLVANAVAKGVHDKLNTLPGGLPVENAMGDSWNLSGDVVLNDATRNIARKAVAQSQLNIISVYNLIGPINTATMFKRVWDYTPRPNVAGLKQLSGEVNKGVDINNTDLKKAVVNLIQSNYLLIIDGLVKLDKLRKA
ncbi:MAG TPA: DUF4157 domain-containing protein [Blastocatellia bacterium]|nr:DUF4157 domain-containing protein [Blastocatellia bacterium]